MTLLISLFIISIFYNTSSTLKNFYLELKSDYTKDGKYLAVINKNGLWIRDKIENKILIINASKIDENFLIDTFVTEFDQNYKVIRNIRSDKIDIKNNQWTIFDPQIFNKNVLEKKDSLTIYSNFNYERINSLFSNLASLSFLQLLELKNNYDLLNYSTVDIKIQIQKIISYPVYLIIMTLFSSILMLNAKNLKTIILKSQLDYSHV